MHSMKRILFVWQAKPLKMKSCQIKATYATLNCPIVRVHNDIFNYVIAQYFFCKTSPLLTALLKLAPKGNCGYVAKTAVVCKMA